MARKPSAAVEHAWVMLLRAAHAVVGAVEAEVKAEGFPPLAWYDVVLELRKAADNGAPGVRPRDLESRLLIAQHNLSRLVDRLEGAGLVRRGLCPQDRRGQVVILTDEGRAWQKRMWPAYRAAIARHVGDRLGSDAEAERLAELLARLLGQDGHGAGR
jgi:DNA-binding MarR family transcriptional regulator